MRLRIFFVALAVLISCGKPDQLKVEIFFVGAYNRQESILRSDLRQAFKEALEQENLEVITEDEYLLQCALFTKRNKGKIKSFLIRWSFTNFDYLGQKQIKKTEDLDSIRIYLTNQHDYELGIKKCKQSFIKQLIKRKIVRVKNDSPKTLRPLILRIQWLF